MEFTLETNYMFLRMNGIFFGNSAVSLLFFVNHLYPNHLVMLKKRTEMKDHGVENILNYVQRG